MLAHLLENRLEVHARGLRAQNFHHELFQFVFLVADLVKSLVCSLPIDKFNEPALLQLSHTLL